MDNTVAYGMYSNEIISLLELRHKIYNRIVVAVNVRNKINEDLDSVDTDIGSAKAVLENVFGQCNPEDISHNSRKLREAELTMRQLNAFRNKINRVIKTSVIDYECVCTKLFEVMRGLRSYDGNMVLHNMWKSGSDIDTKLTSFGLEGNNAKILAKYSDIFSIEMDAIDSAPTHSVQDLISDMIDNGEKERAMRLMRDSDNGGDSND